MPETISGSYDYRRNFYPKSQAYVRRAGLTKRHIVFPYIVQLSIPLPFDKSGPVLGTPDKQAIMHFY